MVCSAQIITTALIVTLVKHPSHFARDCNNTLRDQVSRLSLTTWKPVDIKLTWKSKYLVTGRPSGSNAEWKKSSGCGQKTPSLNRNRGVRIKLLHAWDRTIRTLPRKLMSSSTSHDVTSRKSSESRSTTSEPGWRVVVPPATLVCAEKRKSGWQDLFLTHPTFTSLSLFK